MRKVLHVGPCNTPGGMATVMQTLAEHPPEGWEANLLPSHAPGGPLAKWRAYSMLVENSAGDAGTQTFALMWCTYTWPRIGRGVERRS